MVQNALAEAFKEGWTVVGLGGRGAYNLLAGILRPWEDRAVNLAGTLGPGSTAAMLQVCGGFLGGDSSLVKACGAVRFS